MLYEEFQIAVLCLIRKAGGNIDVDFSEDKSSGKYKAVCSEGTVIEGNSSSMSLSVKWNRGQHQAVAVI